MSNLYTFLLFQSQYKNDSDRNRILDVFLLVGAGAEIIRR